MSSNMDAFDWTGVGMRVYGVTLLVQAFIGLVLTVTSQIQASAPFGFAAPIVLVQFVPPFFFGTLLFLGGGRIAGWLRGRARG